MKKHKILDHPILGGMLISFLALMLLQIPSVIQIILENRGVAADVISCIVDASCIVLILIAWGIYRLFFRKEFRSLNTLEAVKKGCLLLAVPTLLFAVPNLKDSLSAGLGNPFIGLLMGCAPGIMEEILFRGFFISNAMRTCKKYSTILIVLIITAVAFALFHIGNVFQGAAIGATISQVCYAFGLGIAFGAVYLRTGSLLPAIIAHSIIDCSGFLCTALQQTNGILQANTISWTSIVFGIGCAIYGFYLVRPSKTKEIVATWETKWS